jgi:FdrA protein
MATAVRVLSNTYVDSVVQMSGARTMRQVDGVEWASVAMATPANIDTLHEEGFADPALDAAGPGDLFLAARADSDEAAREAIETGEANLFAARDAESEGNGTEAGPRTVADALKAQPGSNVAVVSTSGDYAALEAHKALSAGMDVLLFSDNVSLDEEVELKSRAAELDRLVMGPGAGTAMLGRTCLGFANVTSPGPVAVVAAAGTGAQEAMALLDRWGVGVSHVIGLGGRDLSERVDGRMAKVAMRALLADDATEAILLVSKPPAARVAQDVLAAASGKPTVAALVGLGEDIPTPDNVRLARTLESGVVTMLETLGRPVPDLTHGLRDAVAAAIEGLDERRTLVRGLFSGGTLCYESLVVLSGLLGPVHSNTPINKEWGLPAPAGAHTSLDLGEEEYTKGRPHPMIDPEARMDLLRETAADPDVAVILLDVVLGYGAHDDPASQIAPVCAEVTAAGGPRVVVYVLGTDDDPQGLAGQRKAFADAGCIVTETAVRASLAAAAIATRTPETVERTIR